MLVGLGLKEQSLVVKEAAQVNPTERILGEVDGVVHHLVGPGHSLDSLLTVSSLLSET